MGTIFGPHDLFLALWYTQHLVSRWYSVEDKNFRVSPEQQAIHA